jgi:hypothetical protein
MQKAGKRQKEELHEDPVFHIGTKGENCDD